MSGSQRLREYPSIVEADVAWGDMDAFSHVNNTVYFRFFETGRMDYFRRTRVIAYMEEFGEGPILAQTECRFRMPLAWPDRVSIGTRVTKIGGDHFSMEYVIVSKKADAVAAEGTGRVVWFDYEGGKKTELPPEIRKRINELEAGLDSSIIID